MTGAASWDQRYRATPDDELPWFQPTAGMWLRLIGELAIGPTDGALDVGAARPRWSMRSSRAAGPT